MLKATCKSDGFAIVYGLAVFFMASISGLSILYISQKGRDSAEDYSKVRSSAMAARSALTAFENQCKTQPKTVVDILNKYGKRSSCKWLLGDTAGTDFERRFKCWNASNAPLFSACITKFDSMNLLLQIQGIGYGCGGGRKKATGIYRIKGVKSGITWDQKDAIHLAGPARNFDQRIIVNGNVYCGADGHFNSGAAGSVINGDLKTGNSATLQSSFDGNTTINGNAFFQTRVKINGGAAVIINGRSGFHRGIYTDKTVDLFGDTYINSTVDGNAGLHMHNNSVTHSGQILASDIVDNSASQIFNNGGQVDIAKVLNMKDETKFSFNGQIDLIPSNLIFEYSSLGWGSISAEKLNLKYQSASAQGMLWNGFLVIRINQWASMSSTSGTFNGKVIWIVESGLNCNGDWYDCAASSNTLIYVKSTGTINGMGSGKDFRGYIYVEGNGSVIYSFKNGNSFRGAIHHVSPTANFTLNSGAPLNIHYDEEVLKEFIMLNVIVPPGLSNPGLTLDDYSLRTELLSLYY
ncbi:MAG TPA: hypothetical protein VHP36_10175 [Chitinispirillaceae bacterium]|nr:hypothetical protein [Chitinispirillaceae bacterium]